MRRLVVSLTAGAAVIAAACTDISGSSTAVLSIQFDTLGAPSVVVGDSLRDTTGALITPQVHAFNFRGEEISPAPIRFESPDSGVNVDSITGVISADSLRSTPARIFATVGSLQAVQRVDVTLRPDLLTALDERDSLSYSLIDTTLNVSPQLTVKLTHGVAPYDSAVKSYIVSFAIVAQSNPQLGELVNDAGKASLVDTTDTGGIAGRAIRLHPLFLASATSIDSIIVSATARYRGAVVTGSRVRLVLKVKPRN